MVNVGGAEVDVDAVLDSKSVKKVGKQLEAALAQTGDRASKQFATRFGKATARQHVDFSNAVTRALDQRAVASTAGQSVGDEFTTSLRRQIKESVGDGAIGDLIADDIADQFERKIRRLPLGKNLQIDTKAIARTFGDFARNLPDIIDRTNEQISRSLEDTAKRQEVASERLRKTFEGDLRKMREEVDLFSKGTVREFETVSEAQGRLRRTTADLQRQWGIIAKTLDKDSDLFRELDHSIRTVDVTLKRSRPILIGYEERSRRLGTTIGRVFGRGSRSELINFFAVLSERGARAFLKVGELALKAGIAVQEMASSFGEAVRETGKLSSGFTRLGQAGLTAAVENFNPAGLLAIGVAIAALAAIAGPAAALIASLAGALVALGVAVGGALVGGLAILVGLLAPLAAGIGVTVAAFKSLDDATKKALKQSFEPLKETFEELGDLAAKNIFGGLDKQIKQLNKAFDTKVVRRFVDETSKAVRGVIDGFADAVESPGFQKFVDELTKTLPNQIRQLGTISGEFGAGFGGVLLALQPAIDRFLDRIQKMGEDFNKFANSFEGRKSLSDFFLKAEDALASVGRLLKSVGDAFATLFKGPAGDAGIKLLDDLTGKVQQFVDFLNNNPGKVQDFFEGAVEVAEGVGAAVLGIVQAFGSLNTPATREAVVLLFKVMEFAAKQTAAVLKTMFLPFELAIRGAAKLGFDWAEDLVKQMDKAKNAMKALEEPVKFVFDNIAFDQINAKIFDVTGKLEGLNGKPISLNIQDATLDQAITEMEKLQQQGIDISAAQFAVNMNGEKVVLTFDEAVKLRGKLVETATTYNPFVNPGSIITAGKTADTTGGKIGALGKLKPSPFVNLQTETALEKVQRLLGSIPSLVTMELDIIGDGVGELAAGTQHWRGGLTVVGEQGPELVNLPGGSKVTNAGQTQRILGGMDSSSTTYNVSVNHYGPMSGSESLSELEWLLRFGIRSGGTSVQGATA